MKLFNGPVAQPGRASDDIGKPESGEALNVPGEPDGCGFESHRARHFKN